MRNLRWLAAPAAFVAALAVLLPAGSGARSGAPPGQLTQLSGTAGCVSHDGSGGLCQQFGALKGAWSVAVSDDGKNVYVASSVSDAVVVFARNAGTGALTPLPVPHGCISKTTSGGFCTKGRGLNGARDVVVTPGIYGSSGVYVAGYKSDAVAAFQREPANGALTQLGGTDGCVSKTGSGGDCAKGVALNAPQSLAAPAGPQSPAADRGNLYVASTVSQGVAMFQRKVYSAALLTLGEKSCVSETGSSGVCLKGIALLKPVAIAASSDYTSVASVYVASASSGAVAVFRRNPDTGGLEQLPGMQACVGGFNPCTSIYGILPRDVVVTPDGKYVYVASSPTSTAASPALEKIDGFRRDPGNGALTHVEGSGGCIQYLPITVFLLCRQGHAILGAYGLAVSPDGANVYVAARDSDAVVLLDRSSLGELTERSGTAGCISSRPAEACTPGRALDGATAVAVSPDGKNVYVASSNSNSVAIFKRQT